METKDRDKIRAESMGVIELDDKNEVANRFIELLDALDEAEKGKGKTKWCPECGCVAYVNKNLVGDGYRCCRDCGQDWWIDVEYESVAAPRINAVNEYIYDLVDEITAIKKSFRRYKKDAQAALDEAEKKGLSLCQQNGELLMENTRLGKALENTTKCNTKDCDEVISTSYCSKCRKCWES